MAGGTRTHELSVLYVPGDNLISIHFFNCSETAITEQQMNPQSDAKTFEDLPLEHSNEQ